MDVNAPREEIEMAENEEEEDIFPLDDTKTIATNVNNVHIVAHTLDVCLDKLFNYFITECHDVTTNTIDWDKTKSKIII